MPNIQVKLRRGTATEHNTFTGAEGEVTVDTTNDTLRVHDGSTAGGVRLAKHSELSGAGAGGTVVSIASGTGLTGGPITTSGTLSLASIANLRALGNISGSTAAPYAVVIKDEDDMASNSPTSLATQQSIRAYVDSQTSSSLSVSAWTQGTITSATELQAPDNDKNFAGIYVRSNNCHWNEYATVNYYTDASTAVETFYLQGAGDGGGTVRTSSLLLVPLYTNTSGNKVVKISFNNMAIISGRYWI